ncbi:MAG: hypothetical protein E7Z63_00900 [Thermoplasmata archaeon]|nr:hypothetical protein [Thermoplasmata archaeon]
MAIVDIALPLGLAFISLVAFELGARVREHVHVLVPWKDPVTMLFVLAFLSPVWIQWLGVSTPIDPGNIWYICYLVGFIGPYCLAYIRGEFSLIYVNVHTIISDRFPNGAQEIRPLVYYYGPDGRTYVQEQSMVAILKTVIFGVRSPLRFPIGQIQRTTPIFVQKVLLPLISVDVVDVVEEKIAEEEVQRGPFTFKTRSYTYTPAPSCIDSTQKWLVSAYNQKSMAHELTRKEAQLLESKTTAITNLYGKSADLLVEMIADRTPGADVYRDIIDRLKPEDEPPVKKLRMPKGTGPKAKHKSIFRRSPKSEEPTPEDDGGVEE